MRLDADSFTAEAIRGRLLSDSAMSPCGRLAGRCRDQFLGQNEVNSIAMLKQGKSMRDRVLDLARGTAFPSKRFADWAGPLPDRARVFHKRAALLSSTTDVVKGHQFAQLRSPYEHRGRGTRSHASSSWPRQVPLADAAGAEPRPGRLPRKEKRAKDGVHLLFPTI